MTTPASTFRPEVRKTIFDHLDKIHPELKDISDYLHANPELAYEEVKAHAKLTSYLAFKGFTIESYKAFPTAFRVEHTVGDGAGPVFGLNSEYDALPKIGHACGHNLIAITGVGAFVALAHAMDTHRIKGKVVLIGTPAEEKGGAKIAMLEQGAYAGIDACMMLHPGMTPKLKTAGAIVSCFATRHIKATFTGKSAHAGVNPWKGVNALDAAVIAYSAISAMRQQLLPDTRVHGVITNGGESPNVIPPLTELVYFVRARTERQVSMTFDQVRGCFEGAAKATGCALELLEEENLAELRQDTTLSAEFAAVMKAQYDAPIYVAEDKPMGGSTDFGNVTHEMPGCHPFFNIEADEPNHNPGFTAGAGSADSVAEALKHTVGMACVGARFLADPEFAAKTKESYKKMRVAMAQEGDDVPDGIDIKF